MDASFLKIYFIFNLVTLHLWVSAHECRLLQRAEEGSVVSLELYLQIVSFPTWMLGIETQAPCKISR